MYEIHFNRLYRLNDQLPYYFWDSAKRFHFFETREEAQAALDEILSKIKRKRA